jgi:hypothetical protein
MTECIQHVSERDPTCTSGCQGGFLSFVQSLHIPEDESAAENLHSYACNLILMLSRELRNKNRGTDCDKSRAWQQADYFPPPNSCVTLVVSLPPSPASLSLSLSPQFLLIPVHASCGRFRHSLRFVARKKNCGLLRVAVEVSVPISSTRAQWPGPIQKTRICLLCPHDTHPSIQRHAPGMYEPDKRVIRSERKGLPLVVHVVWTIAVG